MRCLNRTNDSKLKFSKIIYNVPLILHLSLKINFIVERITNVPLSPIDLYSASRPSLNYYVSLDIAYLPKKEGIC